MPKPRRIKEEAYESTLTPPESLSSAQTIARIERAVGNNLYSVTLPDKRTILVELPRQFRSTIWLRRAGFVLVDLDAMKERENKIEGEIVTIVGNAKEWMKMPWWPVEFTKLAQELPGDDEESTVGKMPPSDDEA